MLELGPDLPEDDAEIERWCGEPLRAVVLPTAIFMTNKKGYPTLSRRHQVVLAKLLTMNPRLIAAQHAHPNVHAPAWPCPQLGPYTSRAYTYSGHAWRLWAASHSHSERLSHWAPNHCLRYWHQPPPKSPIPSVVLSPAGERPAGHAR